MSADDGTATGTATDLDDGRYVYCVVAVDDDATDGASEFDLDLDVAGVDGGTPHVVQAGGVGAVVQPCTSAFESTDVDQVGRWLLQHQAVVDAVGERFGTPLPFRFDTVVDGGDAAVRRWLEAERESFESALSTLDGCWEYRIEVTFDRASLADAVADDPSLEELATRCESAGEGTAYLLQRKYDQREAELVAGRLASHRADLTARLTDLCETVRVVERQAGLASLSGEEQSDAGGESTADEDTTDEAETESVSLSVLAARTQESAVGEVLETLADETGASVRFTGPWPPYTYAPELLDGDGSVRE
jgi:hypothetical protein